MRPQEVGQRRRVDRVVLHPARRDGLGRERVGHVGRDAGVGQEVGEPAPAIGRLEGDPDRCGSELAEHPPELVRVVVEAATEDESSGLVECCHLRYLAVEVDPEVHHVRASVSGSLVIDGHGVVPS
jgi:hypothetical protein